jgi:uncharacterized integral membrane protein
MLYVILSLIIGSLLVFISRYNFQPVTIDLGYATFPDIPLFYVIIGAFVIGLLLSYMVSLFQSISTSLTIHGKNNEVKKMKEEILDLTKQVHQLELKNEKLAKKSGLEPIDDNAL